MLPDPGAHGVPNLFKLSLQGARLCSSGRGKPETGLKAKKAKLFRTSVEFLGHQLTDKGIHPQHNKIKAIQDWKAPTDVKGVRSFLGLAGFYRQYVHNFAEKSVPMNALLRKGAEWSWTQECQEGFDALKDALTRAPVLALPVKRRRIRGQG